MPKKEPNKVLILIDKCPDCPKTECPHRQIAGLIPDECPQIEQNKLFVFAQKFFSEAEVMVDLLKKTKVIGANVYPHVSKVHDRNDAYPYFDGMRTVKREPRPEDALEDVCEVIYDEPAPPWLIRVLKKRRGKRGVIVMRKGEADETLS